MSRQTNHPYDSYDSHRPGPRLSGFGRFMSWVLLVSGVYFCDRVAAQSEFGSATNSTTSAANCVQISFSESACLYLSAEIQPPGSMPSMLTETELSGGAIDRLPELQADLIEESNELDESGSRALAAAIQVQDQLRWIEDFLKSGAAAEGDLSTIATGRPDPE